MVGIKSKFPHPGFRKYQKWLLERLDKVIKSDDIKYAVIEAPTGFGKTAVAGAAAAQHAPSYFLTEQKIHQDQMVEEFPRYATTCMGQRNYNCGEERDDCPDNIAGESCHYKPSTTNEGPRAGHSYSRGDLHWPREMDEVCPYYMAKTTGMESQIACLNYSYFFAETFYSGGIGSHGGDFGDRNVMICDETHNVGSVLQNFLSFRVGNTVLDETGLELHDMGENISDWESWISGPLKQSVKSKKDSLKSEVIDLWDSQGWVPYEKQDSLDTFDEILCSVNRFSTQYDPEYFGDMDWAVERVYGEDLNDDQMESYKDTFNETPDDNELVHLSVEPVSVAPFTEQFLFSYADTVILMSATVLDVDTLCRSLGLQSDRRAGNVWEASFPSPFPAENRPIFYYDSPSINNGNWEDMFPHICSLIDAVAQTDEHLEQKGIIHSVSYKNEKAIRQNVSRPTRRRLMSHGEGEGGREETLEEFKEANEPKILMSPNIYEAVDLKDDLCRFQIIPKVPFLYMGSRAVQLKREKDPQWYDWRAALRLIQSFGRGVRSRDDWAKTYILDGSFEGFLDRNRGMFPDYIEDDEDGSIEKRDVSKLLEQTNAKVH